MAKSLLAHLQSGDKIKTLPDGTPKIGAFTSKTIKLAEPFFGRVKVNGVPAVTAEQLACFIDWVDGQRTIVALDQAWPISVQIPDEDTIAEKLQWHRTEVAQLDKVLGTRRPARTSSAPGSHEQAPRTRLEQPRRHPPLRRARRSCCGRRQRGNGNVPIGGTGRPPAAQRPSGRNAPRSSASCCPLREIVTLDAYVSAHERLAHLHQVARAVSDRNRVRAELDRWLRAWPKRSPKILRHQTGTTDCRPSKTRGAGRQQAVGFSTQDSEDSNVLKIRLNAIERQIRSEVEHLAAERSWGHAVAPGRLTGSARANSTQYAQLVSSLGKGTGKYAAKRRVEIAEAMDRCRPSVPVWIMPIYRIAEQVRIQPNLYDVVIVDEASQAGLEAASCSTSRRRSW